MITVTIVNSVASSSADPKLAQRVAVKTQLIVTLQRSSQGLGPVRIAPVEILVSRATELTIQARINMTK
jgi:hypothetical protein